MSACRLGEDDHQPTTFWIEFSALPMLPRLKEWTAKRTSLISLIAITKLQKKLENKPIAKKHQRIGFLSLCLRELCLLAQPSHVNANVTSRENQRHSLSAYFPWSVTRRYYNKMSICNATASPFCFCISKLLLLFSFSRINREILSVRWG